MAIVIKEQENKTVGKPAYKGHFDETFSLIKFLENSPNYKEVKLTNNQFSELIKYNNAFKIELFCDKCDKEKTFQSDDIDRFCSISNWKNNNMHILLNIPPSRPNKTTYKYFPYEGNFLTIKFKCAQCEQEYFFALLLKEYSERKFSIMKVGQYPSFGQLSTIEIEKYKNELKNYFNEFKSSLNCYSQGKGIAAFVYLRRILEHLIETKYKCVGNQNPEDKFIDKLKEIEKKEDIIPDGLKEVKGQIYSILSKGIHEYSEDECMELYDCVKLIVELILDSELEKKKKQIKVREATLKISDKLQENQFKKDGE
jgi:hypothetical protein